MGNSITQLENAGRRGNWVFRIKNLFRKLCRLAPTEREMGKHDALFKGRADEDAFAERETDEHEALIRHIRSPESRRAADALFAATPEELSEAYRPGATETR